MTYWGAGLYPDLPNVASGLFEEELSSRTFRKCISYDSRDDNGWTALHLAAATNNVAASKSLIEYGNVVFLDSRTYKKLSLDNMQLWASLTPLHIAAIAGSVEVAQVLIRAGADVNAVDMLTGTPLDAAMFWGHLGVAQALLAAGARQKSQAANTPSSCSMPGTPIRNESVQNEQMMHLGNRQQDFCQEAFFRAGIDLVPVDYATTSYLSDCAKDDLQHEEQMVTIITLMLSYYCCDPLYHLFQNTQSVYHSDRHCRIVHQCLETTCNLVLFFVPQSPNAVLDLGAPVSFQADRSPHLRHNRSVSLLPRTSFTDWVSPPHPEEALSEPTNITPRRFPGIRSSEPTSEPLPHIPVAPQEMALFTAARDNKLNDLEHLLAEGWNAQSTDNNGWTLLHWAAAGDAAEVAKILIQKGALVNTQTTAEVDFNGRVWVESTPLHVASNLGHLKVTEVLLKEGADTEVCDCTGGTPVHSAAYWGAGDVAKVLVQYGANPMSETKGLSTPLHHACRSGHEQMAEILIMAGALVNAQNSTKQTPLHLAALAGHVGLVKTLVEFGADKGLKNKKAKTPLQCICRGMDIAPSAQKDLPGTKAILRSLLS